MTTASGGRVSTVDGVHQIDGRPPERRDQVGSGLKRQLGHEAKAPAGQGVMVTITRL